MRAIAATAANQELRRLQLANIGSVFGSWAYVVAMLVYAYDVGGATAVALVTIVKMIPAALAGSFHVRARRPPGAPSRDDRLDPAAWGSCSLRPS